MEASSARYAARDRRGEAFAAPSQLQRFIQSACSPENYEPNLALNLEIADLINSKKGSSPREAATTIVGFINHRNPNVALLALSLLDICVKNCGYPFHLQISTKDFLNELVRRFPERPPVRPTRVQQRILGAIEEWRGTICETSRYKEDLGFIRDMHRLLSYKGYTFPEVRREDAAVLNPSDNLKSAEEMEEEEREAQSAKLQELIRRGTPEDLQEANRLMKVMAGYDTRSKVDYRAKAAEDVAKIQQKARLLEERLNAFEPGSDTMKDGDVFAELASSLSSAQPKIQKMCEEESDDHAAVARLLEINDSIHRTVERYKLLKKGNFEAAAKIAEGGLVPSGGGGSASGAQELSLIDLDGGDDSAEAAAPTAPTGLTAPAALTTPQARTDGTTPGSMTAATTGTGIENDLLGLSFGEPAPGGIALGFGANNNVPGPALLSSMTPSNSIARGPLVAGLSTPSPPPLAPSVVGGSSSGGGNVFASLFPTGTGSTAGSKSSTPQPQAPAIQAAPQADPFAALGRKSAVAATTTATTTITDGNDENEWSFSSALPPEAPTKPEEHWATVGSDAVKIDLHATRPASSSIAIQCTFEFSNRTSKLVTGLHFQTAVTKGFELKLQPQSGRTLQPGQSKGVVQVMEVWHAQDHTRKVEGIKLRWRLSYREGETPKTDMGEVPEFELA